MRVCVCAVVRCVGGDSLAVEVLRLLSRKKEAQVREEGALTKLLMSAYLALG